jgi:16S rRNA G966 N2-methylase RsmD
VKQKVLQKLSLRDRVNCYNATFPKYPKLFYDKGWILGYWMIGNYFKNKTDYYGAYPHSYRERVMSMFPDIPNSKILDLFSGSLVVNNDTFETDLEESLFKKTGIETTYRGNAEKLSEIVNKQYLLILADPPYTEEDANHYGVPMINRNKVVSECYKVLLKDGFLVWLDRVLPQISSEKLKLVATIGLSRSSNQGVRTVFIFHKENIL